MQLLTRTLLNPSAYPEPTKSVTLVHTHVSLLFITDNFVYKIKKPVDLGFLNFTTLDRRRFYCEEEVRLNRRLCPDVYLGVVQLRESAAGITFHPHGRIVEYAVKMRRLPEDRMLDRLLRENKVDEADIREIAGVIARFHSTAETSDEINSFGSIATITANWEENFRQVADFVGITIRAMDLELIREWIGAFIKEQHNLFNDRVAGGFIRDCDGDIHAGNICLADKVYIFDCIEFNKRFRYIDTAAEIAFLAMDFDYHNNSNFAGVFVDSYIASSGDTGVITVLDFYKIYRAFVRGKVESFRLHDRQIPHHEKAVARETANRHFRLAVGYTIRRKLPPGLLIFSGLMGTGKSTLAAELAFELGLETARSDVIRKQIANIPESEHSQYRFGEGIYSGEFTHATYDKMLQASEKVLRSGRSIVIDASCSRKSDREQFRALAQRLSVPLHIIHTTCTDELANSRLNERMEHGLDASDGRSELFFLQKAEFEPVATDEGKLLVVDTSQPIGENLDRIYQLLALR
jgi:uncharacterized protein